MTEIVARTVFQFMCPFCGGTCHIVSPDGVMHKLPVCEKFAELEPVDFLKAVNKHNKENVQ